MLNLIALIGALVLLLGLSQAQYQLPLPAAPVSPSRYYLPPPAAGAGAAAVAPSLASSESYTTPAPIITKQFYSISAAEEPQELQPRTKHLLIGRASRNYRVIFIRAPNAQSEAVKYTAELAPQEERTVIYVLSRKQQELEAQDIQAPKPQQAQTKPDVFFIRYKTNDEAAAAQREIQTQYDELGGNTEHAAPYVAPVQSVVGALDAAAGLPPATDAAAGLGAAGIGVPAAIDGYAYQRPAMRLF